MNSFEGKHGNRDGVITLDEFIDYYSDVSQSIPSDEMFIAMMEQSWQCPEHENTKEVQAAVSLLNKEVRARVLEKASNDSTRLKKIFSDFDVSGSGALTLDEATTMIAKLKISVERKMVYPFFKLIDRDNSGAIEFEEFENYVLGNN
jgi:Ca2+-binding EF-hand superfamily protein